MSSESTPSWRGGTGTHPILPGKPPGGPACLSWPATWLSTSLGPQVPRYLEAQLPGYLSLGLAGQPCMGHPGGPCSNRPLLPVSCSREGQRPQFLCLSLESQGTSQVMLSLWAPRKNSVGPVS